FSCRPDPREFVGGGRRPSVSKRNGAFRPETAAMAPGAFRIPGDRPDVRRRVVDDVGACASAVPRRVMPEQHADDLLTTDGADELAQRAVDEQQDDQPELDGPEVRPIGNASVMSTTLATRSAPTVAPAIEASGRPDCRSMSLCSMISM